MTKNIIILYDPYPDQYYQIKNNLKDYTKFRLWGDIEIVETDSLDILDNVSKEYDWAAIIAIGNYVDGQHVALDTINFGIQQSSPLVCHILDKDGYYHFHQQWFAVNLKVWRTVGCPKFEIFTKTEVYSKKVIRDTNNVHDDYTPWWIKSDDEFVTYTNIKNNCFGIEVISKFINSGYKIVNVPEKIRGSKLYAYPEHYYNELIQLVNNTEYTVPNQLKDSGLFYFVKNLQRTTNNLSTGYYVLNTEPMVCHEIPDYTIDCFVGVCGGIKPACIVGSTAFKENSVVHLFDISIAAIEWQKYLIANWDGDLTKLENVFANFKILHPDYSYLYFTHLSFQENINWYLQSGTVSIEEFKIRWQRYKSKEIHFHQINLLNETSTDYIVDLIKHSNDTYLWVSNVFNMDYLVFYKTKKGLENLSLNFIEKIVSQVKARIFYENCADLSMYVNQHVQ